MRGVQRTVSQTVVRALEGDDARSAGGEACCLHGRFHGFRPRPGEDGLGVTLPRPPAERPIAQRGEELSLAWVRMHIPHRMKERPHLATSSGDHPWIPMPRGGNAEGRRQIQILTVRGIPDRRSLGPRPHQGPACGFRNLGDVSGLKPSQLLQDLIAVHRCASHPTGIGGPNVFVHLELEPHRQAVLDDAIRQGLT